MTHQSFFEKLWPIPPEEDRKPSNHFWLRGNAEFRDWVHEPDFWVFYRAGCVLRYASIICGLIALSICMLHKYAGFFPDIMDYPSPDNFIGEYLYNISLFIHYLSPKVDYVHQNNLMSLYLYLINGSSPVLILIAVYYGVLYKKNFNFAEHNILRQKVMTYKTLTNAQIYGNLIIWSLVFIVVLTPAAIAAFFYMQITNKFFYQFFDSIGFVIFVSGLIMFLHSVLVQCVLKQSFIQSYVFYEMSKAED